MLNSEGTVLSGNTVNFLDTTGKQSPLSFRYERQNTRESRERRLCLRAHSSPLHVYSCMHHLWSNLCSLCTPSLESRARCSRNAEPCQALRQAVGASAGECERSIPATILVGWRHQPLLPFSISVTLCLSTVLGVAAPLPPEAGTLLAAQMVQRRCPFGWAWDIHRWLMYSSVCICVRARMRLVYSDCCQWLSGYFATFDM